MEGLWLGFWHSKATCTNRSRTQKGLGLVEKGGRVARRRGLAGRSELLVLQQALTMPEGRAGEVPGAPRFMAQRMPPCTSVLILNKTDSFISDIYDERQKSCWGRYITFQMHICFLLITYQ